MHSDKKKRAVFLDRDGTINEQMGYINHLDRFVMLPGVAGAIRRLNEKGIPVFVVTNQSGLARGYFPESLLVEVHEKMNRELAEGGAKVDGIYICPHHPEAKEERFRINCDCRKPKTGLFRAAAADYGIDLASSYVVGDRWSDLKAAAACGARGVLVLTGYGRGDYQYIGPTRKVQPDFVAEDLAAAVEWIIGELDKKEAGTGS
ncbi:MAG: D-glycero-beta-D-manno-heptose 1,7-bisphosphate 7-phosphatase [Proteobacteria bacterium]|nr:D-glycero-beta-D-manno-heptose 1,7-bisphosphate 7-phosphatase [Pseudomonadota bacterium]MBU1738467.1 D-glycero-beta-D-manno-heptose 1,7-bisphosphate 7-phosphatase [Pseudomonadota bacterium]